jgi:hypothetical protein
VILARWRLRRVWARCTEEHKYPKPNTVHAFPAL